MLASPPSGAIEIHRAIAAGLLTADLLVELGEISGGRVAAAAALVLEAAHAQGRGADVPI